MPMCRFPKPRLKSAFGTIRSALTGIVLFALSGTAVEATDLISPVDRMGRYFGVCFGDGYHACHTNRRTPAADLPIRRDTPKSPRHRLTGICASKTCSISTEIVECEAPYLLGLNRRQACDAPGCDTRGCDTISCDNIGCDGPGFDGPTFAPYHHHAAAPVSSFSRDRTDPRRNPAPQMPNEPKNANAASLGSCIVENTQIRTHPMADASKAYAADADSVPQKRSRMIRPTVADASAPPAASPPETNDSRRPQRIAVQPRKPRRM